MIKEPIEPALIGVDWGTSSFRAYKIDQNGAVIDTISTDDGILSVPNEEYGSVLKMLIEPWTANGCPPIIASGMITSRNGWVETDYVSAPCGAKELAEGLKTIETADGLCISFIPGVSTEIEGIPDVMRGEETQIIGDVLTDKPDKMYLLPGTHSKWAWVQDGEIKKFSTFMTGEIFSILCKHSILEKLMTSGPFNYDGFKRGVESGLSSDHNLLHSLFFARTLPLFDKMSEEAVADYVSGLLIGTEIQSYREYLKFEGSLTIIGRSDLSDRYEVALELLGIDCYRSPEDTVARGHFSIAKTVGLLETRVLRRCN